MDSLEAVTLADGSTAYIQHNTEGTEGLGSNTEQYWDIVINKVCFKSIMFFFLPEMGVYKRGRLSNWMMALLLTFSISLYKTEVCM